MGSLSWKSSPLSSLSVLFVVLLSCHTRVSWCVTREQFRPGPPVFQETPLPDLGPPLQQVLIEGTSDDLQQQQEQQQQQQQSLIEAGAQANQDALAFSTYPTSSPLAAQISDMPASMARTAAQNPNAVAGEGELAQQPFVDQQESNNINAHTPVELELQAQTQVSDQMADALRVESLSRASVMTHVASSLLMQFLHSKSQQNSQTTARKASQRQARQSNAAGKTKHSRGKRSQSTRSRADRDELLMKYPTPEEFNEYRKMQQRHDRAAFLDVQDESQVNQRREDLASRQEFHQYLQDFAREKVGFISALLGNSKLNQLASKLLASSSGSESESPGSSGSGGSTTKDIEDCVGCKMVWSQVEMDIGSARYIEDVQASFEHNCMDAQKSTLFYGTCEDMYDDMYAMTDDYMSNKYSVAQMCALAKMCGSGSGSELSSASSSASASKHHH